MDAKASNLCSCKKEAWKKSCLAGFEPWALRKRQSASTNWVGNPGPQANRLLSIILISNPACRTHVMFTRFIAVRKSTEKSAARVTLKGRDKKKTRPAKEGSSVKILSRIATFPDKQNCLWKIKLSSTSIYFPSWELTVISSLKRFLPINTKTAFASQHSTF